MILIQNIYYMLSYAFEVLKDNGFKDLATESFANVKELCAAILVKCISSQLKRGLTRNYIEEREITSLLRGRIDVASSIKKQTFLKRQMVCSYDNFSEDTYMNRIIKTTMEFLCRSDISGKYKHELRNLLYYFQNVKEIDIHRIDWKIQYNRNNETYRLLIFICSLVLKNLLQTDKDGTTRLMDFLDEQSMHKLYEKFILKYYEEKLRGIKNISVGSKKVSWQLDDDMDEMLPNMQTDITIINDSKVLIIDAKYYTHETQNRYGVDKIHSSNLYQIFTYVKNKEVELKRGNSPHEVSGMLLYAKTDAAIIADNLLPYRMSGNEIYVRSLDLNCNFNSIERQLRSIIENYFEVTFELDIESE